MASAKQIAALEKARAVRRATGRLGGRPRGVLNPSTIARIKDNATFEAEARKRAGRVLNNLLVASDFLDTGASKEILDRGLGPIRKDIHFTGEFALKALHVHALPVVAAQVAAADDTESQVNASPTVVPLVES